jgi:hypothetical protein
VELCMKFYSQRWDSLFRYRETTGNWVIVSYGLICKGIGIVTGMFDPWLNLARQLRHWWCLGLSCNSTLPKRADSADVPSWVNWAVSAERRAMRGTTLKVAVTIVTIVAWRWEIT